MTVKTETAEKGLPSGALSAERIGTSAVSILKVRDLDIGVNPESVSVKTDENGEPLASEIARFRQETGTSNFSIASQSEIDRVNRALAGMNRGPDARLEVYERAKAKLIGLMQSNQASLDDLRKGEGRRPWLGGLAARSCGGGWHEARCGWHGALWLRAPHHRSRHRRRGNATSHGNN